MDNRLLGEMLGNTLFIVLSSFAVFNNRSRPLAMGGAMLLAAYFCYAIGSSYADINPALTLAKAFLGVYNLGEMFSTMTFQIIGSLIGYILLYWLYHDKAKVLADVATTDKVDTKGILVAAFCYTLLYFAFYKAGFKVGLFTVEVYLQGLLYYLIYAVFANNSKFSIDAAGTVSRYIAYAILPLENRNLTPWVECRRIIVYLLVGAYAGGIIAKALDFSLTF